MEYNLTNPVVQESRQEKEANQSIYRTEYDERQASKETSAKSVTSAKKNKDEGQENLELRRSLFSQGEKLERINDQAGIYFAGGVDSNSPSATKLSEAFNRWHKLLFTITDTTLLLKANVSIGFINSKLDNKTVDQYVGNITRRMRTLEERTTVPEQLVKAESYVKFPSMPLYYDNCVEVFFIEGKKILHASRINCFKKEGWIAMQAPSPKKLENGEENATNNEAVFEMAFDERTGAFLQLCKNEEEGYSKIDYAENGEHGKFTVKRGAERKMGEANSITVVELKVKNTETKEERTIMHYLYEDWPDKRAPMRPDDVITLLLEIRKIAEEHCVAVHCQDGGGRTGSFIAIAFLYSETVGMPNKTTTLCVTEGIQKIKRFGAVATPRQFAFVELTVVKAIVTPLEKFHNNYNFPESRYHEDFAELEEWYVKGFEKLGEAEAKLAEEKNDGGNKSMKKQRRSIMAILKGEPTNKSKMSDVSQQTVIPKEKIREVENGGEPKSKTHENTGEPIVVKPAKKNKEEKKKKQVSDATVME